jgi:hypothetical protein
MKNTATYFVDILYTTKVLIVVVAIFNPKQLLSPVVAASIDNVSHRRLA